MNRRRERVQSLIQQELAMLIEREIEFEQGVLATITEVTVDNQLDHAKVKVSILPDAHRERSFDTLKNAQGKLQYLLMKKLNIRPMPRIEFELDHGLEEAAKIEKILLDSESPDARS